MSAATPTRPGFYWAKWCLADQGKLMTAEYETYLPCKEWEVVEVFENGFDPNDEDYLRVEVLGVTDSQSLENFFWGPGPLTPPATP
jgi:hypothetical protein